MNTLTVALAFIFSVQVGLSQNCCPQPPEGYDCYVEPPAQLSGSSQIATAYYTGATDMMVGQTHVTQYIAIYHPEFIGFTYEVQYTDELLGPWKAYARWVAQKNDIVTTFVPVYPCANHRFLRVCAISGTAITKHQRRLKHEYIIENIR
jgi:hypothetical protein